MTSFLLGRASTVVFFVHAISFRKWSIIPTEIPELTFQQRLRCGRGFRDAGVGHGKSVRDQSRSGARARGSMGLGIQWMAAT